MTQFSGLEYTSYNGVLLYRVAEFSIKFTKHNYENTTKDTLKCLGGHFLHPVFEDPLLA